MELEEEMGNDEEQLTDSVDDLMAFGGVIMVTMVTDTCTRIFWYSERG